MTRTAARQLAMQLSFAANSGGDISPEDFFRDELFSAIPGEEFTLSEKPDAAQTEYICALVNGVSSHGEELDGYIAKYAQGWRVSRISKTALCILRCALYEILYMPEIPAAASINEAVELAKSFDEPETVGFINGILGSFMRGRESGGASPEA